MKGSGVGNYGVAHTILSETWCLRHSWIDILPEIAAFRKHRSRRHYGAFHWR
jgi:hypothetical protein